MTTDNTGNTATAKLSIKRPIVNKGSMDPMDPMVSIRNTLADLHTKLEAKGYLSCSASLTFEAHAGVKIRIGGYSDEDYEGSVYEYFYLDTESMEALQSTVFVVEGWIENLPTVAETRKQVLLKKISDTIAYAKAQGEDIAPEIDFIQPLKKMIKKLAENIITDQTNRM